MAAVLSQQRMGADQEGHPVSLAHLQLRLEGRRNCRLVREKAGWEVVKS